MDARILNVSFSARKPDGSFYSSQFLQEKVYLNRMILAKLSTLQVSAIHPTARSVNGLPSFSTNRIK